MKIGFAGLGKMGSGMATNLIKAGHEVLLFNRSVARAKAVGGAKGQIVSEAKKLAACNIVITMLANDRAVEDVVLGSDGLLAHLQPDATHVSMSTISVALAELLTAAHRDAGQWFVSAPVFGRPDAAAAARLAIVVAGDASAVKPLEPLFAAMGHLTLPISEMPRDANLVKISGNFLIASVLEALGEAVALVRKAGIPPQTFIDAMTSTLFNAPVYKTYGGLIAKEQYSPAGFAAPLGHKDVGLALEAATALQVPMPLASLLRDRFLRLLAEGGDSLDWSALASLSASDAGLPTARSRN